LGYIAPIHNFQYNEYSKRVQEKSSVSDPMPIKFTPRISLQTQMRSSTLAPRTPTQYKNIHQREGRTAKNISGFFEEQTGIGRYINEYV